MIKLFDDWVIAVDEFNYSLARNRGTRVDSKTGKERYELKVYGHYSSLASAIRALREQLVREELKDGVAELSEAVRVIKESNDRVEMLLKEALPT